MSKKATLTIEEFRKLPRAEQNVRERELSDHDRFLARIGDWSSSRPLPDRIKKYAQEIDGNEAKEMELLLCLFNFGADAMDKIEAKNQKGEVAE